VVARVGSIDVTADELRAEIAALGEREQAALGRDPAMLNRAVRLLLANRLVLKEALTKKWDERPEIAARLQRIRDAALVETYLQSVSGVPDTYPSEAQIKALYDANQPAMLVPRQFRIAQVFIAVGPDADKDAAEKARRKLESVQGKLKQPSADFAAIVSADSDDRASADSGGELGWLTDTQLRPEIRAQVMGLAKDGASEPIKLEDGWHIIKLLDTKASYTRSLSEVREQLAQRLRDERVAANRNAYLTKLIEQSPPVINELALIKLLELPPK
jgi:peptidylprolyl isomerase